MTIYEIAAEDRDVIEKFKQKQIDMKTLNDYNNKANELNSKFPSIKAKVSVSPFGGRLEIEVSTVEKAKALANEADVNYASKELQELHKSWKEDIGPVAREYREEIWEKFSAATKVINDKRQDYYSQLEEKFEENLKIKNELIAQISAISEKTINSHKDWQANIKEIEALREAFFKTGKCKCRWFNINFCFGVSLFL